MKYIPCTIEEEKKMLKFIGVKDFNELIDIVPKNIKFNGKYEISTPMSEIELIEHIKEISSKNTSTISFLGAGVYDRYIPSIVDFIASRSEFYTAYTPYQAEVSQGTLQYLYEFQTQVSLLTGMDISNASMYDGSTAAAEAVIPCPTIALGTRDH